MKVVFITDIEKEFDKKLAAVFSREGYKVYAMSELEVEGINMLPLVLNDAVAELTEKEGRIDIYIDVINENNPIENGQDDFNVRTGLNDKVIRELYDLNVILPMALLEAFFPLIEKGEGKRLCYLTSAQASINETRGTEGYGYKMAKAGLHQFLQITRNVVAPREFTMRVFDPMYSEVSPELAAEAAFNYFTRKRGMEQDDEARNDEGNLVFRDAYGRQHAW